MLKRTHSSAPDKQSRASPMLKRLFLERRKSMGMIEKLENQILNLENVMIAVDTAKNNAAVFEAYKNATQVLKDQNRSMGSLEDVEQVLDSLNAEVDTAEEINELLGQANPQVEALDREAEAELENLTR
eukprot:TRINITY_DN2220_c0_g1_i1.p1 TRINITY_DN2220_c0_g1~~TRINITY_DN2220_c0_g1_i1.p1  ORF type:complete len:129 (-),score=32.81 TRINITY_DN2220_c0_g1_i1:58-444(-)